MRSFDQSSEPAASVSAVSGISRGAAPGGGGSSPGEGDNGSLSHGPRVGGSRTPSPSVSRGLSAFSTWMSLCALLVPMPESRMTRTETPRWQAPIRASEEALRSMRYAEIKMIGVGSSAVGRTCRIASSTCSMMR